MKTLKTVLTAMLLIVFAGNKTFAQYTAKFQNEEKAVDIIKNTPKVFRDNPKEVVITEFKVIYRMFKGESVQGSAMTSLTNASYGTSATMNVMLNGVTKELLLKNANEIYADFVNGLEGKGYKVGVLDAEKVKASKKFAKDNDAKILNGETFESTHKKMLQSITVVPNGVNSIEMSEPEKSAPSSRGGASGGAISGIKKTQIINDVLEGREVLRMTVSLIIDFVDFSKKGSTITYAKLTGAPQLHIGGEHITSCGITFMNKKMIFGMYNGNSDKEIFIAEDDWANEMKETTSFEFLGSKLKNYELPVNAEKYCTATKVLAKTYLGKYISSYENFVSELNK